MRHATQANTTATQLKPKPRNQAGRIQKRSTRREKMAASKDELFECGIPDKAQPTQSLEFLKDQVINPFLIQRILKSNL